MVIQFDPPDIEELRRRGAAAKQKQEPREMSDKPDPRYKTATKTRLTVWLDDEVLAFVAKDGKTWSSSINEALKAYQREKKSQYK